MVQETPAMATNEKGSDLDVFEGLSKKGPGASSPPGQQTAPPPPPRAPDASRTLLGITPPSMASPLPPPPGRTALPPVAADAGGTSPLRSGVDVDWDDEDEATQIFDKGEDGPRAYHAPPPAAGAPPPSPVPAPSPPSASMKSTLLGLTPPMGGFP